MMTQDDCERGLPTSSDSRMVAALYVEYRGVYWDLPGVEPWGLPERDAREYAGPWPVVAHPPCNRWAMPLAKVNETRYGHRVGDDGGCFAHALDCVRRFGGVLEQPANTAAWRAFDLPKPLRGWQRAFCGGWVCQIAQVAYGHRARKATWLYAYGCDLPELDTSEPEPTAYVSHLSPHYDMPRLSKREAKATPIAFRDMLLDMARSVGART